MHLIPQSWSHLHILVGVFPSFGLLFVLGFYIAGLVTALLAMLAGGFELRTIDARSEAMQVATWHMMLMAMVWFCFAAALILQRGMEPPASPFFVAACAVAGFLITVAGARMGGTLVYEFGVAVKTDSKP